MAKNGNDLVIKSGIYHELGDVLLRLVFKGVPDVVIQRDYSGEYIVTIPAKAGISDVIDAYRYRAQHEIGSIVLHRKNNTRDSGYSVRFSTALVKDLAEETEFDVRGCRVIDGEITPVYVSCAMLAACHEICLRGYEIALDSVRDNPTYRMACIELSSGLSLSGIDPASTEAQKMMIRSHDVFIKDARIQRSRELEKINSIYRQRQKTEVEAPMRKLENLRRELNIERDLKIHDIENEYSSKIRAFMQGKIVDDKPHVLPIDKERIKEFQEWIMSNYGYEPCEEEAKMRLESMAQDGCLLYKDCAECPLYKVHGCPDVDRHDSAR